MKLVQSSGEIPELKKSNVHIKNEKELIQKVNKIINDGNKKLQIVTDFDHTLTRHTMDDGSMVLTSFGMFRECPSIPQEYKDEDVRLWAQYKPIEDDPNMTIKEKTQHMIEWYIASNNMLKDVVFPRNELTDVGKTMVDCFRKGVKDMITWSETQQVPVLVFSAGLGESVLAAMKAANFLLPHVKVVSNFLDTDSHDKITGIKGEVIHCYNKNETVIKHTEYYEMVKDRNNVILMGDNLGDAGMAEGMEHCDVVIKVGFLGDNVEGNLNNYLNTFDIVLVREPSVDVVNAILKLVL
ncbi:7-methylguanosine phosphate-specific 5'-nucleotidase [Hyposmocoma kahamanoa]|uniref:7-methylguanosine phosphate-specific 5'-nucleotidase n=1 Tax=Hyposmocoma kahamanoa TaxID=1477025 RepID=UPI000E6D708B|nr:7-methylguanosine phosphate-specific 5'-nucleotidase [Hyposmocoma kahamanoa]